MTQNVINQLRRLNLTYAQGFVKYCDDSTEIEGFEENVTDRKRDGQKK